MKLQSSCWLGLWSLKASWAVGFTSKMAHTHGFGQEDSVLHRVGLSMVMLGHPHNTAVGQVGDLRESLRTKLQCPLF